VRVIPLSSDRMKGSSNLMIPSEQWSQCSYFARLNMRYGALDLRIKSLIRRWPLTCSFTRKPFLTCVFLFRLLPTVHGRFRLARGFFVGWKLRRTFLLADELANRSGGGPRMR